MYKDNKLIGYSRVFAPGIKYDTASIGRIVTDFKYRGLGIGKEITIKSIEFIKKNYPNSDITISAQLRLRKFYRNIGFVEEGNNYLEDGIAHIKMILNLNKK